MLTSHSEVQFSVRWVGVEVHTFKRFANITRNNSRNTAQRGRAYSFLHCNTETGVKTRLSYKTQDVGMSTHSNVLGQITEKDTAFIFCVRQNIAIEFFNTEAFEFHDVTLPCIHLHNGKQNS